MNKYLKLSLIFVGLAILSFLSLFYTIYSTYGLVETIDSRSNQEMDQKLNNLKKTSTIGTIAMAASSMGAIISGIYGYKHTKK